jgi:hypothetical protein
VLKGEWWRRMNSNMRYLIYCKNFCEFHNVLPPRTTIKKKILTRENNKGKFKIITSIKIYT